MNCTSIGGDDIMRKITELASKAFWDNEYFKLDNTMVLNGVMQLHRTNIAVYADGVLTLNTDGYRTNTTKERLNGLLRWVDRKIYQKKGIWYIEFLGDSVEFKDGMEIKL